jgi:arylsulfatase
MPDQSAAIVSGPCRRTRSIGAALFAVVLLMACQPLKPERPDVLLVTVDTLRADHLGVYGLDAGTSPNIDALGREGVVFERAIAAASRTVPAHASIMTSRHVREHSVGHLNGRSKLVGHETVADHFRRAGYRTAAFIGNILITRATGLDAGFDLYDDALTTPELNRPGIVERLAEDTTARALEWLAATDDRPAFLWVHYQDPHGPYTPPPEDAARFDFGTDEHEAVLEIGESNHAVNAIPPYQALPGLRRQSEYRSRYAGEIFYADRSIGELVAAFDARAGERGSVVLLTADHGESLGESGRYFLHTHASTPDVAHVPLIVRAAGLTAGRRDEVVGHVDVLPTLLDLAGLDAAVDASGFSLAPLARGESTLPDRHLYCDLGTRLSAYRGDGFTSIHGLGGAWPDSAAPLDVARAPWRSFRWRPGSEWQPTGGGRGNLPADVRAYVSSAEPMAMLPPPDPALTRQLTALGYTDANADANTDTGADTDADADEATQ